VLQIRNVLYYKSQVQDSVTKLGEILLFGYFMLKQYLHFQLNKQLQNMVCCTYFHNQKDLGIDVLVFQFELGHFGYSLGYISKYWAKFLFNFLVTLVQDEMLIS
jgi:hypothetical protein